MTKYLLIKIENKKFAVACVYQWDVQHTQHHNSLCIYKNAEHKLVVIPIQHIINLVVTMDLNVTTQDGSAIVFICDILGTSLLQSWTERVLQ